MAIHRMYLSTQLYVREFFFFPRRNELLSLNKLLSAPARESLKSILIMKQAAAGMAPLAQPRLWLSLSFQSHSPSHSSLYLSPPKPRLPRGLPSESHFWHYVVTRPKRGSAIWFWHRPPRVTTDATRQRTRSPMRRLSVRSTGFVPEGLHHPRWGEPLTGLRK